MIPVVTPAQMADADRAVIDAGTPSATLIERAAHAVARAAVAELGGTYGRRVVVVAGGGNNGADGIVAARLLRGRGVRVDEFRLDPAEGASGLDRARLARALDRADLAIDAMYGTGFRGSLDGDAAFAAEAMRSVPTLAVDIPSGVHGGTGAVDGVAVHATATVTMAATKRGLVFEPGRTHAGRVIVADIGIPVPDPGVDLVDDGDVAALLPRRRAASHKWSAAVLVVGGSRGMAGAPSLVGRAALRSGAGIVHCGVPGAAVADALAGTELVVRIFAATDDGTFSRESASTILDAARRFGAVAIGPGLGTDGRTAAMVQQVVAEARPPIVVDADGLNALAGDLSPLRIRTAAGLAPAVLTPHDGEFARLAGHSVQADRVAAARELADATRSVVLLKGPATVVAAPDGSVTVNPTGGPALATAGTGDVLTGVLAALLAQGLAPAPAAAVAAFVHGRAGEAEPVGMLAGDLVDRLPSTLAALTDRPGD